MLAPAAASERRVVPRFELSWSCAVGDRHDACLGRMVDISLHGVQAELPHALAPGRPVQVRFRDSDNQEIAVAGRVVWARASEGPATRVGIEFDPERPPWRFTEFMANM